MADQLPLSPMFAPAPFNAIAIDLFKPGTKLPSGYRYILTIVCLCTRWVHFVPLKSKFAAEVMLALCRNWFLIHGVPEFILSDRGKEFLGVVITLCKLADIKHIRTTPGHPQANGLCEVQHKTLTRELRIRSAQRPKTNWSDLLPEIQFAINTMPDDEHPSLSPFQLVFGRRPRLSGKDITFPRHITPNPIPPKHKAQYVRTLCDKLQGLRLTALDRQLGRKQRARERHDRQRSPATQSPPKRGDLVHVYRKTSRPKLQFQWSSPTWLVTKCAPPLYTLKPLVSAAGRGGVPPSETVFNVKYLRVAGLRPADFWIGAKVRRLFKKTWFLGTVTDIEEDEGKMFYKVHYQDCDQDEIDVGQLWDAVIYHPRLDDLPDLEAALPKLGECLVCSLQQQPRIGQVVKLRPGEKNPIALRLWRPSRKADSWIVAKYKPDKDVDNEECYTWISPVMIRYRNIQFDTEGYLTAESRTKMRRAMKGK